MSFVRRANKRRAEVLSREQAAPDVCSV